MVKNGEVSSGRFDHYIKNKCMKDNFVLGKLYIAFGLGRVTNLNTKVMRFLVPPLFLSPVYCEIFA